MTIHCMQVGLPPGDHASKNVLNVWFRGFRIALVQLLNETQSLSRKFQASSCHYSTHTYIRSCIHICRYAYTYPHTCYKDPMEIYLIKGRSKAQTRELKALAKAGWSPSRPWTATVSSSRRARPSCPLETFGGFRV